ncbi:MAG: hypothetical protein KDF55_09600, partial [Thauera sp.]|nr:hypothetical protein [Thauera sp.]
PAGAKAALGHPTRIPSPAAHSRLPAHLQVLATRAGFCRRRQAREQRTGSAYLHLCAALAPRLQGRTFILD